MEPLILAATQPLYVLSGIEDREGYFCSRSLAVTADVYQDAIYWNDADTTRTQHQLTTESRAQHLYNQIQPILGVIDLNKYEPVKLKAIIQERFPRSSRGLRIASFSLTRINDDQMFLLDFDCDEPND